MKSIGDILNLLATPPSDGSSLLGGKAVSGKSSSSNGNSFGDLLTQLANQQDNASTNQGQGSNAATGAQVSGNQTTPNPTIAPNANTTTNAPAVSSTGSLLAVSQTDITITESLQSVTPSQVAQAEQSLATLAAGLSKLLNLFSNLQNLDPQQAQNAIVALGGGQITPADAMGLLNAIQSITQKNPGQNPLLMSPDQQNGFLSQAFQQMLQAQQLALGTFANNISTLAAGSGDPIRIGNVILQMSFSDTSIAAVQQTGSQSSQVFIDLETFQMSATFIQAGAQQGQLPGGTFQPLPQSVSDPLLQSFNQALLELAGQASQTAAVGQPNVSASNSAQIIANTPDQTTQTFQNLVQLLVQSGASQAVLTSYLNQATPQGTVAPSQSQVQNTALDQFLTNLTLVAQNPTLGVSFAPATVPAVLQSVPADQTPSAPSNLTGLNFIAENIVQTSVAMETQVVANQAQAAPGQNTSSQAVVDVQMSAISMNLFEANLQGVVTPPMDATQLNNLNDAVARFSAAASTLGQAPSADTNPLVASLSVDQLLVSLEAIQVSTTTNSGSSAVIQDLNNLSLPVPANVVSGPVANLVPQTTVDLNVVMNPSLTPLALTGSNLNADPTGSAQTPVAVPEPSLQAAVQENVSPTGINVQVEMNTGTSVGNLNAQQTVVLNSSLNMVSANMSGAVSDTTSVAQNISVSLLAGTTVTASTQNQAITGNNLNTQTVAPNLVLGGQTVSEVKPVTPDAVLAIDPSSKSGENLNLNVASQDATATVIEVDTNLLAGGSLTAPDKSHATNSAPGSVGPNIANGSINSAQILNQITDQIAAQAADARAVSRLSFQLVPESLGRVTVQIALVDQSVSARIVVTNPEVKDAIQHHMVDLKAALGQAGLQIDQLQVQVQGGGANLLAQYYQYQQEGFGYRLPAGAASASVSDPNGLENTGDYSNLSVQLSLVNVLA